MKAHEIPVETFITEFESLGPTALAAKYQCGIRNIFDRRRKVEYQIGKELTAPPKRGFT